MGRHTHTHKALVLGPSCVPEKKKWDVNQNGAKKGRMEHIGVSVIQRSLPKDAKIKMSGQKVKKLCILERKT